MEQKRAKCWSERGDSNSRPLAPEASALPGCATLRPTLMPIAGREPAGSGVYSGRTWRPQAVVQAAAAAIAVAGKPRCGKKRFAGVSDARRRNLRTRSFAGEAT